MRLRQRLSLAFVCLAVMPLLVAGLIMIQTGYRAAFDLQLANQRREARLAASEVAAFVDGLVREMTLVVRVKGLDRLDAEGQRRLLGELSAWENQFDDLAYLDADGLEQAHVSLHHVHVGADLGTRTHHEEFEAARASGSPWFGPIEIDADTAEPLMAVAIPAIDPARGTLSGVLVARLRLKRMWDVVMRLSTAGDDLVYITDPSGLVVAHPNPSLVLRGARAVLPDRDGRHRGLGGAQTLAARVPLAAGGRALVVVAERPIAKALALPLATAIATLLILAAALMAALGMVWLAGRAIIAPIQRLADIAGEISAGNLSCRANDTERNDEIGELARAFNGMTTRLRDSLSQLEAKVAERTHDLSKAQDRLVEGIESISEGFVLCDAEDCFVLCNQKFRDFYPGVAHLMHPGRPYREVIEAASHLGLSDDSAEDPEGWVRRRMALRAAQLPHIQRLSSGRWLLINERTTLSGQKVAVYTDITELKRIEEALRAAKGLAEKAAQAKSSFLAAMSHELRTPLNAIIGFSDAMLSGVFGPLENPRYHDYVRDIHGSGLHLLDLINDVLDLSKIEAGRMVVTREPVDCAALITRAVVMMKELAGMGGLDLASELDVALPPVMGDERRLLQVLLNLLSNAVKFTPEGGRIRLRTATEPGHAVIEVADTGIGIAPSDIPRALEIFGQLDGMRSRRFPGSGLGLPLARQLVELHDGTLTIESQPGHGTIVRVRLPLASQPVATEPEAAANR